MTERIPGENKEGMESVDLGVALALRGKVLDESLRLAKLIQEKVPTTFVLGGEVVPHITLFQGRFPASSLSEVHMLFEGLALNDVDELHMEERLFFRPNGNVFWNVKPNEALTGFYQFLNDFMMPHTEGLLMDQFQKILDDLASSEDDKKHIRTYGTVLSGERFMPHVTLGRLENPENAKALEDISIEPTSFLPEQLILGELGQYGEVRNVQKTSE